MAGNGDAVGNIGATAEFNVWADPEAAAVGLAAATPERVTFVGWDAARRDAVITSELQGRLRALDTPLSRFVDDINSKVADWAAGVTVLDGYDLPDPATMATVLEPDIVTESEEALVDQVRGQLVIDRRLNAGAANVRLVRRLDADRFAQLLVDTCFVDVAAAPSCRGLAP